MPPKCEGPRFLISDELRVVDAENGKRKIVGYAARYNSLSHDLGGFRERILPGAFNDALGAADVEVLALMNHDTRSVIGRKSAGTLTIKPDSVGLYVEIDPPNTTAGNDAVENVRRKDIKGMSFRFPRGAKDTWSTENGQSVRTLHKLGLMEVSLTPIPAYEQTSAELRAAWGDDDEIRSYYAGEIAKLKAPAPTPKLDDATKRMNTLLASLSTEERATIEVDDNSLVWTCRDAIRYARMAFDSLQCVVDCVNAVKGDLTDADQTAADDCLSAILDLTAKSKLARAALAGLGAKDDAAAVASDTAASA